MQINTETRTDDVRALAIATALGSIVGLSVGGAYLAGSFARATSVKAATADVASRVSASRGSVSPRVGSSGASLTAPSAFDTSVRASARLQPVTAIHNGAPFASADTGDRRCLAQAVYYEARGESPTGQVAVAQVVLNRARLPSFPKSLCGVVYQRSGDACQFSFACNGAMRGAVDETAWRRAEQVAGQVLRGAGVAEVRGATMFQAVSAAGRDGFAGGLMQVAKIGAHVFYRLTSHGRGPEYAALAVHRDLVHTNQDAAEPRPVHVVYQGLTSISQPSSSVTTSPAAETLTSSTVTSSTLTSSTLAPPPFVADAAAAQTS